MKGRPAVTYLVSGDESITESEANLRESGRRVRHDTAVDARAAVAMKRDKRYVVVAHGSGDGTVMWFRSDGDGAKKWLWVGMGSPPKGARIYLYSCQGGKELPQYLKHCECFGHDGDVPMPHGSGKDIVLAYLDTVDRIMTDSNYNRDTWRAILGSWVNDSLADEAENPRFGNALYLLMLRKSLGYFDD